MLDGSAISFRLTVDTLLTTGSFVQLKTSFDTMSGSGLLVFQHLHVVCSDDHCMVNVLCLQYCKDTVKRHCTILQFLQENGSSPVPTKHL